MSSLQGDLEYIIASFSDTDPSTRDEEGCPRSAASTATAGGAGEASVSDVEALIPKRAMPLRQPPE